MRTLRTARSFTLAACIALTGALTGACGRSSGDSRAAGAADSVGSPALGAPVKVAEIGGFQTPESARYDSQRDVWFVSNINGVPSDKDGNGYITRISGDRSVIDTMFVAGGTNGVTLHAPKGLAITGDTVWVADIDAVRGFDVHTGASVGTIDLAPLGAVFLNDIAVGPDGALYVTDSGIRIRASGMTHPGPDRVFRISDRTPVEALRFTNASAPNGIAYDAERGKFVIVPFASTALFQWTRGATTADSLAAGPGGYDGVEVLADGRTLLTSWNDSTVHVLDGRSLTPFIRGVPSPADIGIDTTRGLVAIPIFEGNRVEFWTIPAR